MVEFYFDTVEFRRYYKSYTDSVYSSSTGSISSTGVLTMLITMRLQDFRGSLFSVRSPEVVNYMISHGLEPKKVVLL